MKPAAAHQDVVPVKTEHYLIREPLRLSIDSASYTEVAKKAREDELSVVFVHSHPTGPTYFSDQDDREEPALHRFLQSRIPDKTHGSWVIAPGQGYAARIWTGSSWQDISLVRVLGDSFRFTFLTANDTPVEEFFDRQVRAFGDDLQRLLGRLHIGIVGCGGTGSAVAEQLARLGVAVLSLFDGDTFEASNINRVYGSTLADRGRNKAEIAADHIRKIGLGTTVLTFSQYITREDIASQLRDCDIVFGCTDKEWPRSILSQLAVRYLIPVFDLGIEIKAPQGTIVDLNGRVTLLLAGEQCLFCRGRIDGETVAQEGRSTEEQAQQVRDGYAKDLPTDAPAVIFFTSATVSLAIQMLIQRLTGFMGEQHNSTELVYNFLENKIRGNKPELRVGCFCADRRRWGRGDTKLFLDQTWPG